MAIHLILISLIAASFSLAKEPERLIDDALHRFGLDRTAFDSDRIWAKDDTFLLDPIRHALSSPLAAREVAFVASGFAPRQFSDFAKFPDLAAMLNVRVPQAVYADVDSQLVHAPSGNPLEPLSSALTLAEGYRKQAFDSLSPDQRQALLLSIPLWFEDEDITADDSLKGSLYRAFGIEADTSQDVSSDSVLTLLARVNRNALSVAGYAMLRGVALMAENPPDFSSVVPPKVKPSGVEGDVLYYQETPLGRWVVGGSGANRYTEEFSVIIDLGGDDQYLARCASAVGGIRHSTSVVLDYSGNDFYAPAQWLSQSSAVMGLSALVDLSGDDTYRAGAFSQSASFCGVSLLYDGAGDDLYTAGWFSQSAAVCGISLFTDVQGRDLYDGAGFGQAFASTYAFASLVDGEGNDVYRAGGLIKHEPLRPEDYRSMSQGFAMGFRPRGGGGIAVLHDLSGNDFYDAEIYAQGVGYWYSLGALLDDGGNDSYSATQYAQGSGIHLACGVLEDVSGDDRYTARFGPSQGAAHDLAVGILCDGSGDDYYTASGGQGMAITNSAALFVDVQGNDLYAVTEPTASQGGTRPARNFGNLALFVDGEGKDVYTNDSGADSTVWFRDHFGYGVDVSHDSTRPREADVTVDLVPSDTTRPLEDLFDDASKWEVTDNREKVRHARLALSAIGIRAVRWVGENKLTTNSALERRAMTELFKSFPDSSLPYLRAAFEGKHLDGRRNAVAIVSEMKTASAGAWLEPKLAEESYSELRPSILRALGEIGYMSAVPVLNDFAGSKSERERLSSIVALGKLKDSQGFEAIFKALTDSVYTVRSAAVYALAEQSPQIVPELQRAASVTRDTEYVEQILLAVPMLAARWNGDEALKKSVKNLVPFVRMHLEHPASNVQGAALVAAAAVMDAKTFDKFEKKYETTKDPILAARWKQAKARRKS